MVDFRHERETYDVAILGSGLGGSALAAILARQGQRVLLLEKGAESHLFRAEIDEHMVHAAVRHGAVYRERIDICDLEVGDEGVFLRSAGGEEFHARFLIDGTGHTSLLAGTLGVREETTRLRTRSRSIFTHMTGIRPYDDTLREGEHPGLSARWYEGTLHHIFDGGWFWVIPFDNHDDSENPLCSVGLTLDMRKYPERGLTAEEELREIVARYPSIAAHFAGATAVRPWGKTGRLQYSSTRVSGDRWFLLAHAAGFVDALYSRGLISTFETVHALAGSLLEALREDDFRAERFASTARLQEALLDAAEDLTGDLLDASEALLAAVEAGVICADEASQRLFEHLELALGGMAAGAHPPEVPAYRLTPEQELAIAMA